MKYTNKESRAILKARQIIEQAGMYIESEFEGRDDGLEEWLIHSGDEE